MKERSIIPWINRILLAVVVVWLLWYGGKFGMLFKVHWDQRRAVNFHQWLRSEIKGDPRYERLVLEGVSWSGPGHPVYISMSGTVHSQVEWLALRNLIHQANPPVRVETVAIFLEKENMLAGYLK